MELKRRRARVLIDLTVTLTTVPESVEARIVDLSEQGAQIAGAALPEGRKFQIEYMGQTLYAQCVWAEVDRMGVRFPFPLTDGPLYDALQMAMPADMAEDETAPAPFIPAPAMTPSLLNIPIRRAAPVFGRRG